MATPAVVPLQSVFGIPRLWLGIAAAVIGVMFWIGGLYVLHRVFDRLAEADADR